MPNVTGFFHGGITVSDMDRALVFYRDGLGLEQEFDRILDGPYLPIVLGLSIRPHPGRLPAHPRRRLRRAARVRRASSAFRPPSRPCDYGAGHLCLYVDDVEAMHARLVGLGFAARSAEVVEITAGPNTGRAELST